MPTFSEEQIAEINTGLRSNVPAERADTIVSLLGTVLPALPKRFRTTVKDAETWKNANSLVYEAIGGVNLHALWAAEHPGEFYKQMGTTFAAMQNIGISSTGPLTIVSSIPESPLDTGDVIDADELDDDE